jgi:hypothetical protein
MSNINIGNSGRVLPEGFSGTATAIAHTWGYSKASASVMNAIQEAVESGALSVDNSGRYTVYTVVSSGSQRTPRTHEEALAICRIDDADIPEKDIASQYGYTISTKKSGDTIKILIKTSDNKKLTLKADEKLVIINDKPQYVISAADQLVGAIWKFAKDNNYAEYVVSDVLTSKKIQNASDIDFDERAIISLTIKKHNKAA